MSFFLGGKLNAVPVLVYVIASDFFCLGGTRLGATYSGRRSWVSTTVFKVA